MIATRVLLSLMLLFVGAGQAAASECPSGMLFSPDATGAIVDAGVTGLAQDMPVMGYSLRMGVSCAATTPPCGSCSITGLIANAGGSNQRCKNDTSTICTVATEVADCGGAGLCSFFAAPPTPISTGGVATCYTSVITGPVSGTVDVDTGALDPTVPFQASLYSGVDNDHPCPRCIGDPTPNDNVRGGSCDAGPRVGLACDANGAAFFTDFGSTSFDCPPNPASSIADFFLGNVDFSTATQTRTVSASSPDCTAAGYTGKRCLCDSCNNINGQGCFTNADCPVSDGQAGICGGRRCIGGAEAGLPCRTCVGGANHQGTCSTASACPGGVCVRPTCAVGGACGRTGEPTRPNVCNDDTSTGTDGTLCVDTAPAGDGKGECQEGPVWGHCSLSSGHGHRECSMDSDCCDDPFFGCTADPVTPGECVFTYRPCFTDNGLLGGSVSVTGAATPPVGNTSNPTDLGMLTCIPPVSAPAVNAAGGFPGLGRQIQPGQLVFAEEIHVEVVAPGGTSTTSGSGPASVVETSVTTPVGGQVTIVGTFNAGSAPLGYEFLGRLVQIEAQPSTAASPLRLSFDVAASEVPAGGVNAIQMFRNGVGPIPNCLGATQAIPDDPCVTERTTLGGGDARVAILTSAASDWTMAEVDEDALCPPAFDPMCRNPFAGQKAQVQLTDKSPDDKDQLQWKWLAGSATTIGEFGDPVNTDNYSLCLYDNSGRRASLAVPMGGTCAANKPCWSGKPTQFQYKDKDRTPSGIEQILLKAGLDGKAKIQVKGKGINLPMPAPGSIASPLRVQLRNLTSNLCWSATYSTFTVKPDGSQLKGKAD